MITIREASAADIPSIHRLAETAFPTTYAAILTPAQIDYMMEWMYSETSLRRQFDEGQTFYLAEELPAAESAATAAATEPAAAAAPNPEPANLATAAEPAALHARLLGYLSIERQGPALFHLQKLYLHPAAQGRGIGAALFRQAVGHVRRRGELPARLELNVNRYNRALGFYERMGMRRLRSVDLPIGDGFYMNDYIMGLDVIG